MNVESILRSKGRSVATIRPGASIAAAIDSLRAHGIGALVVGEGDADGDVAGILSERDIVRALAEHGAGLLTLSVATVMTRAVATCAPEDSVAELMAEMTARRIRHFPVVRDHVLCGIVSIGDLVKSRLDEIEDEARSLRSFIVGA